MYSLSICPLFLCHCYCQACRNALFAQCSIAISILTMVFLFQWQLHQISITIANSMKIMCKMEAIKMAKINGFQLFSFWQLAVVEACQSVSNGTHRCTGTLHNAHGCLGLWTFFFWISLAVARSGTPSYVRKKRMENIGISVEKC